MSGYRTLRVSNETALDLARALWLAREANRREGNRPAKPEAEQAEALGRIVREWSSYALASLSDAPGFEAICKADWRCACGSTGINKGLLTVTSRGVLCQPCLGYQSPGDRGS